jgi:hypothetical protein
MPADLPIALCPAPSSLWFQAPAEGSGPFYPTFRRISIALQMEMRRCIPSGYFSVLERYRDVRTAYPMLVYQCSRSFRGRSKTDYTHDVLNSVSMARMFRLTRPRLTRALPALVAQLQAAGLDDTAKFYDPKNAGRILRAVRTQMKYRRPLEALLVGEGRLVNELIRFHAASSSTERQRASMVKLFRKRWTGTLRHIFPGSDFRQCGPGVLNAATRALASSLRKSPARNPVDSPLAGDETILCDALNPAHDFPRLAGEWLGSRIFEHPRLNPPQRSGDRADPSGQAREVQSR